MYLDNLKIRIMYSTAQWNIINTYIYTHTHTQFYTYKIQNIGTG